MALGLMPGAASAAPSPVPSAMPSPKAAAIERTAIVSCVSAPFVAWPDRSLTPSGTHYPRARLGDAIHVVGTDTLTPGGMNLTETTIDVFEPYGRGKHYWIATDCIT